jgi:hypothetical protein
MKPLLVFAASGMLLLLAQISSAQTNPGAQSDWNRTL